MSRHPAKLGKQRRPYDSTRRQAQARETRRQILESAGKLFIEHGYAGATLESIAQEAGVSPQTVFATFGNKRTILANLIDLAVGGDEQPLPLLQRPGPQAVKQDSDQRRQIRLFVKDMRQILERVGPIFEIMRLAAKTEPEIATLLQRMLNERLQNLSEFVKWVAKPGPLRAGLTPTVAAETVWALTSAELYRLLTVDRAWSGDRYEQWLGDTLILVMLP
jgi:AcrR family transcriptional regulator